MKDILFRLLVAAAVTLAAFALSSSAHGQQTDEDATPTNATPHGRTQQIFRFLRDTDSTLRRVVFSLGSDYRTHPLIFLAA
jgi:hypothetical protein